MPVRVELRAVRRTAEGGEFSEQSAQKKAQRAPGDGQRQSARLQIPPCLTYGVLEFTEPAGDVHFQVTHHLRTFILTVFYITSHPKNTISTLVCYSKQNV